MKKSIVFFIIVSVLFVLTSCDPEACSKLGDIMGKMGNNVYGISANMTQVQAATESLSGSVSDDGSVDLDKAAEIISAVAEVKNSAQKTEALKEELSKPVTDDATTAAAVQTELQNKISEITNLLPSVEAIEGMEDLSENQKAVILEIRESIASISISDSPTMAELATVAILNEMVESVNNVIDIVEEDPGNLLGENGLTEEAMSLVESALSSIDALKTVSEVTNNEGLSNLNLSTILSSLM